MGCLSVEQIEDLVAERVPQPLLAEELSHLQDCDSCARRVEEFRANRDLMHDLSDAFSSLPSAPAIRLSSTEALDVRSSDHLRTNRAQTRDPSVPPEDIPGYHLIREIHRGGQGVVYEAVQESTRRTVAVKVMLEGAHADDRARWRFEREVRLVAGLKHPNIVAIHDSGIAQGRYYFAMDYVRGLPLDTYVRLAGLPIQEIIRLMASVCDAVAYAHRRGIIHRDIKPSNILVSDEGVPQVLDFGLAKLTVCDEEERNPFRTMPGHILGTIRYMSPEQTRGDLEAIDTRTDVYALGFILYELLTGLSPYETDKDLMTTFRNIREVDPPRPSRVRRDITSDLDAITLKAMQKEPHRRYSSAEELRQDLLAWLDDRPISARSDSSFYVLRKLAVRHYFHTSAILALLAALVGFAGISYHFLLQTRDALARQRISDIGSEMANKDMKAWMADAQQTARQHAFGWFLVEWRDGNEQRAREILAQVKPGSPEELAMRYLLEGNTRGDELEQVLTPKAAALYHFVLAEQHLQRGGIEQARAEFNQCLGVPGDDYEWFRKSAATRLQRIDAESITPATGPAGR